MAPQNVLKSTEALAWLEKDDGKERTVAEDPDQCLETDEALRLVRELYQAGAVGVLAQDIVLDEDFEMANSLKVMLPQEGAARKALFRIEARVLGEIESQYDPEGEQGQESYTIIW